MTPVHITKRALAVVGTGVDVPMPLEPACGVWDGFFQLGFPPPDPAFTCPACLVLLDAELEGRGAEVAKQRAEIEAGR